MGRAVNFDAVPDTGVVPDGTYQVHIAELEETASKSGKLMYNARLEILEPVDFAGMGIFESFVVGDEDDPDAANDATWVKSVGARRLKQMLKAAQVPMDNDMDNIIAAALQQQLVISATQQVDDGKNDPQYAGRVRNRIGAFHPLGHKEVGLTEPTGVPGKPAAKPAPARPAAVAPAATRPAPVTARPAAPPARPTPAPASGVLSKPAGAPATKPVAAKAAVVLCTICNTSVPRGEFAAHVEAHADET